MKNMYAIFCVRSEKSVFGESCKFWAPRGKLAMFDQAEKAKRVSDNLNDRYGSEYVSYHAVELRFF